MERIEAWVRDQSEVREAAEDRVRLARVETERAEMRRLTWEGRRSGKREKKDKEPKEPLLKRFKKLLVRMFGHHATELDATIETTILP